MAVSVKLVVFHSFHRISGTCPEKKNLKPFSEEGPVFRSSKARHSIEGAVRATVGSKDIFPGIFSGFVWLACNTLFTTC